MPSQKEKKKMSNYTVQQFVKHANQYEDLSAGDFQTEEEAISGMDDLIENCGFTDLRVIDSDGCVIAESKY